MSGRVPLPSTLTEGCRERLGLERAALFDRLMDDETGDPHQLMDVLREDQEFGVALVECDTVDSLAKLFSENPGEWSSEAERSGPLGDVSFGVAWTFQIRHDRPRAFNGLPATNRKVTVRGFTIIAFDAESGRLKVRRYVDWAAVFAQLGLTLNWRVPVPADAVQSSN
jgi:hypothetical protein